MGNTPRAASSRRGAIIDQRGGPRHGPPYPPTLGRAPAEPCRASEFAQARSSINVGGPRQGPPTPPTPGPPPPGPAPPPQSPQPPPPPNGGGPPRAPPPPPPRPPPP